VDLGEDSEIGAEEGVVEEIEGGGEVTVAGAEAGARRRRIGSP